MADANRGGLVAIAGAVVLAVGSVLAWAKVEAGIFSRSLPGTDGDGKLTVALAGVVGLIAVVALLKRPVATGAVIAVGLGGLAAAGIAIYDIVNVNGKIDEVTSRTSLVTASVGVGLYVCVVGAALVVVGALMAWSDTRVAVAVPTSRPCPYCAEQIQAQATVCRFCDREVTPVVGTTPEGWYPDPVGRHPDRWWDGTMWTRWVRDAPGGTRSEDPQPWTASP
jgi:uncharacterized membrane protein YidH (DUF202 family)